MKDGIWELAGPEGQVSESFQSRPILRSHLSHMYIVKKHANIYKL